MQRAAELVGSARQPKFQQVLYIFQLAGDPEPDVWMVGGGAEVGCVDGSEGSCSRQSQHGKAYAIRIDVHMVYTPVCHTADRLKEAVSRPRGTSAVWRRTVRLKPQTGD